MTYPHVSDSDIAAMLNGAKTIALLGASANPARDSNEVMRFLQSKGHRVIPVNPGLAGQSLRGETVYAKLADIPDKVDMIDVFRASEYLPGIVEEAIASGVPAIWTQLGVIHPEAAEKAEQAGIRVVMNRCPKIEYPRLRLTGQG